MDKAVQAAVAAMPGKAVEAAIGKEEGRIVYKVEEARIVYTVEIDDNNIKTQKVYVDARTMRTWIGT